MGVLVARPLRRWLSRWSPYGGGTHYSGTGAKHSEASTIAVELRPAVFIVEATATVIGAAGLGSAQAQLVTAQAVILAAVVLNSSRWRYESPLYTVR